jgi:hypothetical protein
MPSGRIPPMVIQQWGKVKHDLVPFIEKLKGPTVDAAYRSDLKKKVETLFGQFDAGLRDAMKKANDAKTDADAKKYLQQIVTTSTDYMTKLKAAQKQWGDSGRSIGDTIEKNLKRIKESAETTLKSIR